MGLRVVAERADRAAGRGPLLRWYGPEGQAVPHPWEIEAAGEQAARERDQAMLRWRQAERERERERKAREQAEAEHLRTQQRLDAALAEVARLRARLGLPGDGPDAPA